MYPAHVSALLEIDLIRMAREQGFLEPRIPTATTAEFR